MKSKLLTFFILTVSAMLCAFSFFSVCPSFLSWIFPILSSAVLIMVFSDLYPQSARHAFLAGWWFGLIFFGVGISWVYISIHDFGNVSLLESSIITMIFAIFLGLFPAMQGYFLNYFFAKKNAHPAESIHWTYYCLAFPALGTLLELLKSWVFTGFPWLEIGIPQIHGPIAGFAPIIGSYGCGLLAYTLGGLVVYASKRWMFLTSTQNINQILNNDWVLLKLTAPLFFTLLIVVSGYFLSLKSWTRPVPGSSPILVSLIQGNIPQSLKWDENNVIHSLKVYYQATEKLPNSRLIIWPETAIPMNQLDAQEYLKIVENLIQKNNPHAALITGIPLYANEYFNAAILLGNGSGIYQKHHLVPFGEYIPFQNIFGMIFEFLNIPMSDFTKGPAHQALMESGELSIATFICYETAYANYVRERSEKSNLLIALSDDAWFGDSEGPYQHLEMSQMRALENGRYLLNSTNNGITAIITPNGDILKQIPGFSSETLTSPIMLMEGMTPYQMAGFWPLWIALFLMLLISSLSRVGKK
jgi:apolipoprotein N-acyltransferase